MRSPVRVEQRLQVAVEDNATAPGAEWLVERANQIDSLADSTDAGLSVEEQIQQAAAAVGRAQNAAHASGDCGPRSSPASGVIRR